MSSISFERMLMSCVVLSCFLVCYLVVCCFVLPCLVCLVLYCLVLPCLVLSCANVALLVCRKSTPPFSTVWGCDGCSGAPSFGSPPQGKQQKTIFPFLRSHATPFPRKVMKDSVTRRSRGFGFITFKEVKKQIYLFWSGSSLHLFSLSTPEHLCRPGARPTKSRPRQSQVPCENGKDDMGHVLIHCPSTPYLSYLV